MTKSNMILYLILQTIQTNSLSESPSNKIFNTDITFLLHNILIRKTILSTKNDLLSLNAPTIIGGDFNSANISWNNTRTDARGRKLAKYVHTRGYAIMGPLHPTRLSDHTSSTYDSVLDILFLIKNINNINQPKRL